MEGQRNKCSLLCINVSAKASYITAVNILRLKNGNYDYYIIIAVDYIGLGAEEIIILEDIGQNLKEKHMNFIKV